MERSVGVGGLAPGQALPSVRELATELGVNPNTVAAAYRTLRDRGVIETAGRRGSRVRPRPASTPREEIRVEAPEGVRDISRGNPAPELLPPLHEALTEAVRRTSHAPVLYGAPAVLPELSRVARARLSQDGVLVEELAVTAGALDGIERVLAAHLRAGDAVAVEDPGWGSLLDLIPALGLRTLPIPVDDEGPLPAAADHALAGGASALVLTSRAQNPTGAAVSEQRATELRGVLARHRNVLLIEDDHGSGITELPLNPLAGATSRWAHVRSTAKACGPDLRLAVLAGDRLTIDRVQGRQRLGPGWVSHLLQHTVALLWESGAVDASVVARAYDARREPLLRELRARGVPARGRSGMNVWVSVPEETGAVARLLHTGWAVAPGARFRLDSAPGVRLTVPRLTAGQTAELAGAVRDALRPSPTGRLD